MRRASKLNVIPSTVSFSTSGTIEIHWVCSGYFELEMLFSEINRIDRIKGVLNRMIKTLIGIIKDIKD